MNLSMLIAVALAAPATQVTLDGEKVAVYFSDGDSLRIKEGRHKGARARLEGYNTLESYGPVHSWGEWTGAELYEIAGQATERARAGGWHCESRGTQDRYGRIIVYCADLALALVSAGLAHVFYVDPKAAVPHGLLVAQRAAIGGKLGMWRKGVPVGIPTSLHSAMEQGRRIYNRVTKVATGIAEERPHNLRYDTCARVCIDGGCLLYVPYERRYGKGRPECLRGRAGGPTEGSPAKTPRAPSRDE